MDNLWSKIEINFENEAYTSRRKESSPSELNEIKLCKFSLFETTKAMQNINDLVT